MVLVMAVQVRHAAEDQVSAARQEAQRAIRDLQTAASRLQVPLTADVWPGICFCLPRTRAHNLHHHSVLEHHICMLHA